MYTRMLEFQKRHYLVTKVEEATTDSKQLFQLVGTQLGCKEDPLPEATSNSVLAEDFASFFLDKIDIRSRFDNISPYKPEEKCNVPLLRKFAPVSTRQLEKTITSMPSKCCALHMPTTRLKEVL